jgi:ankyrin repeat protein
MDYGNVQHGLLLAARSGNLQSLDSILGSYPELDVNFVDDGGLTPLIHCVVGSAEADGQHAECCQVLLDVGASSAFADATEGRTALHWAVVVEREDLVSQLITAGEISFT